MPKHKSKKAKQKQQLWIALGIAGVAAVALIGFAWSSANQKTEPVTPIAGVKTDAERLADRTTLGKSTAKVEVVEWGDFLWPACAQASKAVEPQLAALVESGEVKFTYKHMVVVGDKVRSQWAAEAAECAADQGKFWAYHDQLFANQKQRTKQELKTLGAQVGVDTEAFNKCVDSGKYESAVKKQSQEGYGLGLQGTPTFFVNGKQLQLQRSYDEVVQAVKKELGK